MSNLAYGGGDLSNIIYNGIEEEANLEMILNGKGQSVNQSPKA